MLFQQSSCTIDGEFNGSPFYSCDNRFNYIFFGTDSNWLISIGSDPRKSDEYRIVSKSPFHHIASNSCPPVFTEWSNGLFLSCADYKSTKINTIRKGWLLLKIHKLCKFQISLYPLKKAYGWAQMWLDLSLKCILPSNRWRIHM